jgi:blocked-early-in-transport protein 1
VMSAGSSRYSSQAHQRDNRTQLFANVNTYNPSQLINGPPSGSSSRASTPYTSSPYRQATPNSRGQYSDQVLSQLESQNDDQIEGLSAKVKILKDVR